MIRNTFRQPDATRGRIVGLALATLAASTLVTGLAMVPTFVNAAGTPLVRVQVSDLDLALDRDRKILERRISAAIDRVCTPTFSGLSTNARDRKRLEQCRQQAREGVQQQLAARGLLPLQVAGSK